MKCYVNLNVKVFNKAHFKFIKTHDPVSITGYFQFKQRRQENVRNRKD